VTNCYLTDEAWFQARCQYVGDGSALGVSPPWPVGPFRIGGLDTSIGYISYSTKGAVPLVDMVMLAEAHRGLTA